MIKKLTIWMSYATILITVASCTKAKDFLDTTPKSEYSSTAVWASPGLIQSFLNDIYKNVFSDPFDYMGVSLSNYSGDEAWFNEGENMGEFNSCLLTPDNLPGWTENQGVYTDHLTWGNLYSMARKTNLFFENTKNTVYVTEELKNEQKGQAYFLRGTVYFYLTSLYGGVPLVTRSFQLNDDYLVTRNTYEDCINYIVGQLDSAALYLPDNYGADEAGLATKGAALTLKSRVLLYAASDLHHDMASYAPGYAHPEFLGYTGANRATMWQNAKDAAAEVMKLGYSLYKADPDPSDSVASNIKEYFISKTATSEDIFMEYFSKKSGIDWNDYDPYYFYYPNGYHGWGGCQPTSDLIDAFEMKDGSSFNWNDPIQKASPYTNREARFYASILFEGAQWAFRPADISGIDPYNRLQTGSVDYPGGNLLGADAGSIDDWSGGVYTGYFYQKFLDPTVDYTKEKPEVPFRFMRYAEVLLNYAEACIELGQEGEARTYINMIRKRAGQPDITESGDELRDRYRHERRIEMAFEGSRFFDVRRWMDGSSAYHPISKVVIKYTADQDITNYLQPDGSTWSAPSYSTEVMENYAWDDKAYFFPISRNEITRDPNLIQNPGY